MSEEERKKLVKDDGDDSMSENSNLSIGDASRSSSISSKAPSIQSKRSVKSLSEYQEEAKSLSEEDKMKRAERFINLKDGIDRAKRDTGTDVSITDLPSTSSTSEERSSARDSRSGSEAPSIPAEEVDQVAERVQRKWIYVTSKDNLKEILSRVEGDEGARRKATPGTTGKVYSNPAIVSGQIAIDIDNEITVLDIFNETKAEEWTGNIGTKSMTLKSPVCSDWVVISAGERATASALDDLQMATVEDILNMDGLTLSQYVCALSDEDRFRYWIIYEEIKQDVDLAVHTYFAGDTVLGLEVMLQNADENVKQIMAGLISLVLLLNKSEQDKVPIIDITYETVLYSVVKKPNSLEKRCRALVHFLLKIFKKIRCLKSNSPEWDIKINEAKNFISERRLALRDNATAEISKLYDETVEEISNGSPEFLSKVNKYLVPEEQITIHRSATITDDLEELMDENTLSSQIELQESVKDKSKRRTHSPPEGGDSIKKPSLEPPEGGACLRRSSMESV